MIIEVWKESEHESFVALQILTKSGCTVYQGSKRISVPERPYASLTELYSTPPDTKAAEQIERLCPLATVNYVSLEMVLELRAAERKKLQSYLDKKGDSEND